MIDIEASFSCQNNVSAAIWFFAKVECRPDIRQRFFAPEKAPS
jgi:hypothetical protein